jgi:hypothetical protein
MTPIDHVLHRVVFSLAHILVPAGYGIGRVNQLTRAAFVDAAKAINVRAGNKLSIARIAVVTGLTRTEVSQLLSEEKAGRRMLEPKNRAHRVANGWNADARFSKRKGCPTDLPYDGTKSSFSELVRRYSGDIPPRAMLEEMKRLRLVRQHDRGCITLLGENNGSQRKTIAALEAVSTWVDSLAHAVGRSDADVLNYRSTNFSLHFESFPQVMAAMRELEGRQAAFVEGLKQVAPKRSRRDGMVVDVSVALAATRPKRMNFKEAVTHRARNPRKSK